MAQLAAVQNVKCPSACLAMPSGLGESQFRCHVLQSPPGFTIPPRCSLVEDSLALDKVMSDMGNSPLQRLPILANFNREKSFTLTCLAGTL